MANPSSPLPHHPCCRLWPAKPLTWQDSVWGLPPTICPSCNKVSKPQSLLAGFISHFCLWHFYKHHRFPIPLWRSPRALISQPCKAPWVCVCILLLRSLEKWKLWLDSALSWPLRSGNPGWPVLISLAMRFQPGVWGWIVESMRHSRAWALKSNRIWKPVHHVQVWPWARCWPWGPLGFTSIDESNNCFWYRAAKMVWVKGCDASEFSVWNKYSLDDSSYYQDYFYGSYSTIVILLAIIKSEL